MNHFNLSCLTLTLMLGMSACTESINSVADNQVDTASTPKSEAIEAQRLSDIVKVLASDEFEGRAPGGPGEVKTIAYLVDQFEYLGLEPGGTNGTWTHAVPLIHTQLAHDGNVSVSVGDVSQILQQAASLCWFWCQCT